MPGEIWVQLLLHSQTLKVQPLKFGNELVISFRTDGCNCLSMTGLKLIPVSKRYLKKNYVYHV